MVSDLVKWSFWSVFCLFISAFKCKLVEKEIIVYLQRIAEERDNKGNAVKSGVM